MTTGSTFNWRDSDSYRQVKDMVRADWAWEALRRNPQFQESWTGAHASFDIVEQRPRLRILQAPKNNDVLERWGCLFCDAPELRAHAAIVLWQPALYARALPMAARSLGDQLETTLFRLEDMQCDTTLVLTEDGLQHMLVRNGGRGFQLVVHGHSLIEPVHLVADAVLDPKNATLRLKTLQCFNDLRATGELVPSHIPTEPATPRLRLVMQALDGSLAGASYREIGAALFGQARIEAEWHNKNRGLRDQVRRAVKRGETLMNGGYLGFLR